MTKHGHNLACMNGWSLLAVSKVGALGRTTKICLSCGSHLFYRLKDFGECEGPVGLFDSIPKGLSFTLQVCIDKKPGFRRFAEQTDTTTEQQVLDMYSTPS